MPTSKAKTTKKPTAKVIKMPAPIMSAPMPAGASAAYNVIPMPAAKKKPTAKKPAGKKAAPKAVKAAVKPAAKKLVAKKPASKMKMAAATVKPARKVVRKKK